MFRQKLLSSSVNYCTKRWKLNYIVGRTMLIIIKSDNKKRGKALSCLQKKLTSCVSVIASGDFCRLKLDLPSLLFMSKDEVKAAHSDFDHSPEVERKLTSYPSLFRGRVQSACSKRS